MFNSNSYAKIQELKNSLMDFENKLESIYFDIQKDVELEHIKKSKKDEEISKRSKILWKILNDEMKNKLFKSSLPIKIKLFNKININGSAMRNDGILIIYFSFGNSRDFKIEYTLSEIEAFIKKKYPNIKLEEMN